MCRNPPKSSRSHTFEVGFYRFQLVGYERIDEFNLHPYRRPETLGRVMRMSAAEKANGQCILTRDYAWGTPHLYLVFHLPSKGANASRSKAFRIFFDGLKRMNLFGRRRVQLECNHYEFVPGALKEALFCQAREATDSSQARASSN